MLLAPVGPRLRAELRGGHAGEQAEGRRPVLGAQQVAGHGQPRALHISEGGILGCAQGPYLRGQDRAGVLECLGDVLVRLDRA